MSAPRPPAGGSYRYVRRADGALERVDDTAPAAAPAIAAPAEPGAPAHVPPRPPRKRKGDDDNA